MVWLWILPGLAVLCLLAYWALVVTEGAYLGRWVVALLYNSTVKYYDRIKFVTWQEDQEWLITPLLQRLEPVQHPLVLDVGTGSGRFPLALLSDGRFDGAVWGLDISLGMLRRARARLSSYADRCRLIWGDADALPFPNDVFDVVVCLETIEFTPRPRHTLGKLVRSVRPGGTLLFSNRVAWARWFPGRTYDDDQLLDLLSEHPLENAQIHNWNTFYDLVWVRKAGPLSTEGRGEDDLTKWLVNSERYQIHCGVVKPRGFAPWSPRLPHD
jgi:ubiquinone/menaquinone biosynthesis C-methylase UbiE